MGPQPDPTPVGLYIHIPFCERKCPYCDFNTYAGLTDFFGATVDALVREMELQRPQLAGRTVGTVFLGGGTPTILSAAELERLFAGIYANFRVAADAEITSEANPGVVDRAKFAVLRSLGVNRLSMGVQSFQPAELDFLGRIHDVADVYRAVEAARSVGFDNVNLDFIFGLPHQSVSGWQDTLRRATELEPEHLSLYSLIVEPETPLYHWVETGRVDSPDDDEAAALYETAMARLAAAGYCHYEISNWTRTDDRQPETGTPSLACRHNLVYWRNQEYLGIGPGAHSHLRLTVKTGTTIGRRWGNRKAVQGYIRRLAADGDGDVEAYHEDLAADVAMGETMMLGLRLLREGVSLARFHAQHGVAAQAVFESEIAQLRAHGLLEVVGDHLRLTSAGILVGNQVFLEFLAEPAA